jgi:ribosome-associated translation inhibitor RaiA
MNIETQALNFTLPPEQINYVERRLKSTLGANSRQINRIEIWLSDIHATDCNKDYRCLVQVELEGQTMIIGEGIDSDLYTAIHRATDQAGWKVPRVLGRQHRRDCMLLPSPRKLIENRLRNQYMLS